MNRTTAIERLNDFDKNGRYVFTSRDLAKIFHEDSPKALNAGLNRLVKDGVLTRAIRGVYVYAYAKSKDAYTLERIVLAQRRENITTSALSRHCLPMALFHKYPWDGLPS